MGLGWEMGLEREMGWGWRQFRGRDGFGEGD